MRQINIRTEKHHHSKFQVSIEILKMINDYINNSKPLYQSDFSMRILISVRDKIKD
jgi:hypothetical protein